MRLQVNNEFQLVKIKDLNDENNVTMFTSSARGCKSIYCWTTREPQTRITKLNSQKLKITPTKKKNLNSAENMDNLRVKSMGFLPRKLKSERFRTMFNMYRIEKTKLLHDTLDKYDKKKYSAKKRKLRGYLMISGKVLVLAERIRKKSTPGKFYKEPVQNISYFNKEKTFSIVKKQKIDYYWLKNVQTNKKNIKKIPENWIICSP